MADCPNNDNLKPEYDEGYNNFFSPLFFITCESI